VSTGFAVHQCHISRYGHGFLLSIDPAGGLRDRRRSVLIPSPASETVMIYIVDHLLALNSKATGLRSIAATVARRKAGVPTERPMRCAFAADSANKQQWTTHHPLVTATP
jgi:hypothetical protein